MLGAILTIMPIITIDFPEWQEQQERIIHL